MCDFCARVIVCVPHTPGRPVSPHNIDATYMLLYPDACKSFRFVSPMCVCVCDCVHRGHPFTLDPLHTPSTQHPTPIPAGVHISRIDIVVSCPTVIDYCSMSAPPLPPANRWTGSDRDSGDSDTRRVRVCVKTHTHTWQR